MPGVQTRTTVKLFEYTPTSRVSHEHVYVVRSAAHALGSAVVHTVALPFNPEAMPTKLPNPPATPPAGSPAAPGYGC